MGTPIFARPLNATFLSASPDGLRFAVLLPTTDALPQSQRHVTLVFNFLN